MKLHEKITQLRKEKGMRMIDLRNQIKKLFGDKALTYRTIQRIEKGENYGQGFSLCQICMALGVTMSELKSGTDEEKFNLVEYVRNQKSKGKYTYNDHAYAEMLTGPDIEFFMLELTLEPGGKTRLEKDPADQGKFKKSVYVIKGQITCIFNNQKYVLRRGDVITFDSTLDHYFENNTSRRARCLIVQNPRHI